MSEARARALLIERIKRERMKKSVRADLFDLQLAVYDDREQFRANHTGRRGGKSHEMPNGCLLDVLDAGFNEAVILAAETQKKAKALHWANLTAAVHKFGIPLKPAVQDGAFIAPWGARIQFWGINDDGAVELLRGFKMKSFRGDEVQTWSSKVPRLVSSVLEPALGDTGGTCTLYGTPSVTRSGHWADICLGNTPGWSVHHWDVRQNKKFPRDAESLLQQVLLRNKWTWDHPTFQREWLGNFVNDSAMQVYRFERGRNTADCLPCPVDRGFTTLGIDYGTTDEPCAWVVLWSPRGSREIYVVEAQKHYRMLPDDAAEVTKSMIDRWRPRRIVGDAGGLGAPYVEAFNRRYGHIANAYVHPADKRGKLGHIAIFNGELESGRVKILPAADDLAHEMQHLPWKNDKRIEEDPGFDNHECDGALYALVDHMTDVPTKPVHVLTEAERIAFAAGERKRVAAARASRGLLRT